MVPVVEFKASIKYNSIQPAVKYQRKKSLPDQKNRGRGLTWMQANQAYMNLFVNSEQCEHFSNFEQSESCKIGPKSDFFAKKTQSEWLQVFFCFWAKWRLQGILQLCGAKYAE